VEEIQDDEGNGVVGMYLIAGIVLLFIILALWFYIRVFVYAIKLMNRAKGYRDEYHRIKGWDW